MTTKTISGTLTAGYTITPPVTILRITKTGYVEGPGVYSNSSTANTVKNSGKVDGAARGVFLYDGGSVTNGTTAVTTALIEGYDAAIEIRNGAGSVTNFADIVQQSGSGVAPGAYLADGGVVTNGGSTDISADIKGVYAVFIRNAKGTVTNFGSLTGSGGDSVALESGGLVTNGSSVVTSALIQGAAGVDMRAVGTVINYGTIDGDGVETNSEAVYLDGGRVTNGSGADHAALMKGYGGVWIRDAAGTVVNFGTIRGTAAKFGFYGVGLSGGGSLTNGGTADTSALVAGYFGVEIELGPGSAVNFGTIEGSESAEGQGVYLRGFDATVTNGSAGDTAAFVEGYVGVHLSGAGSAVNYGTIKGGAKAGGRGLYLENSGANMTNGSSDDKSALVEGYVGAVVRMGDTLTNFGTVSGAGGVAVEFEDTTGVLAVEPDCKFVGAVKGLGDTLELAGGTGTISGLAAGTVTVSGSMPTTTFQDFDIVEVAGGARFTLSGNGSLASDDALDDAGALSVAATLSVAGSLEVTGTLSGVGTLALAGGSRTDFNAGTALTIAKVTVSGATTKVDISEPTLSDGKIWTQTAGTLSVASGDRVNFTGKGDAFDGTLTGAGTIALFGGSDTLTGATLSANSVIINGATVTLAGTTDLADTLTVTTPDLIVGAGGATLSGGGTLSLTNAATNTVVGADAGARLTSDDTIRGAGQIGDGKMTLDNAAGALIDGDGSVALVIDTGDAMIVNAGTILASGSGGVVIDSALDNMVVLIANPGTLTVDGEVLGVGHVNINGGAAIFGSTFNQNVDFTGPTGVLELSQAYSGKITGFSKTGTTSIDLEDIAFTGTTTGVYTGTTTSGVLTVTEGTKVAKITFEGDYLTSTFTLSAAPGGGTLVIDPAKAATAPAHVVSSPPTHQFIAAMASFEALAGVSLATAGELRRTPPPMLATPRAQMA